MKIISKNWGGQTIPFWGDEIWERPEGSEESKPPEGLSKEHEGQRAWGGSMNREAKDGARKENNRR